MSTELKIWAGMDYLTASKIRVEEAVKAVVSMGKLFESTGEEVAWQHGYKGLEICGGNGQVLSRERYDQKGGDVLVRLPGRALDWIRDRNILTVDDKTCTDADICRFFDDHEFDATRLDVAMDTNDPAITLTVIENAIRSGFYTCRAKRAGSIDTWMLDDPLQQSLGETLTLGGRSSSRYFRAYNKRAETLAKTGEDIKHRTRFEMEQKGAAAFRVMQRIAAHGSAIIPAIMSGWINFKDPNDPTPRKDRKRNIDWWERLVGGSVPIILGLSRGITSPERSAKWLKKGVAKTLALAEDHGLMPEIRAAMEEKRRKIKPAEKLRWEHYSNCRKTGRTLEGWNAQGPADAK